MKVPLHFKKTLEDANSWAALRDLQLINVMGFIAEARKLEHHSPHALKVNYKGS